MNRCAKCKNNCCSNKFIGLKEAFKHTAPDVFVQILLSNKEAERIRKAGGEKYLEQKNGVYCMSLNPDYSCKAYKNGICDIYEARPDVCKLYPFFFDPFAGLVLDKNCDKYTLEDLNQYSIEDKQKILDIIHERLKFFEELNKTNKL